MDTQLHVMQFKGCTVSRLLGIMGSAHDVEVDIDPMLLSFRTLRSYHKTSHYLVLDRQLNVMQFKGCTVSRLLGIKENAHDVVVDIDPML